MCQVISFKQRKNFSTCDKKSICKRVIKNFLLPGKNFPLQTLLLRPQTSFWTCRQEIDTSSLFFSRLETLTYCLIVSFIYLS
jgi:hypothetical protein